MTTANQTPASLPDSELLNRGHVDDQAHGAGAAAHGFAPVTLEGDRLRACFEATWELDALSRHLTTLPLNDEDEVMFSRLVLRGMAGRMLRLSNAIMAAIGDPTEPTNRLLHVATIEGRGHG